MQPHHFAFATPPHSQTPPVVQQHRAAKAALPCGLPLDAALPNLLPAPLPSAIWEVSAATERLISDSRRSSVQMPKPMPPTSIVREVAAAALSFARQEAMELRSAPMRDAGRMLAEIKGWGDADSISRFDAIADDVYHSSQHAADVAGCANHFRARIIRVFMALSEGTHARRSANSATTDASGRTQALTRLSELITAAKYDVTMGLHSQRVIELRGHLHRAQPVATPIASHNAAFAAAVQSLEDLGEHVDRMHLFRAFVSSVRDKEMQTVATQLFAKVESSLNQTQAVVQVSSHLAAIAAMRDQLLPSRQLHALTADATDGGADEAAVLTVGSDARTGHRSDKDNGSRPGGHGDSRDADRLRLKIRDITCHCCGMKFVGNTDRRRHGWQTCDKLTPEQRLLPVAVAYERGLLPHMPPARARMFDDARAAETARVRSVVASVLATRPDAAAPVVPSASGLARAPPRRLLDFDSHQPERRAPAPPSAPARESTADDDGADDFFDRTPSRTRRQARDDDDLWRAWSFGPNPRSFYVNAAPWCFATARRPTTSWLLDAGANATVVPDVDDVGATDVCASSAPINGVASVRASRSGNVAMSLAGHAIRVSALEIASIAVNVLPQRDLLGALPAGASLTYSLRPRRGALISWRDDTDSSPSSLFLPASADDLVRFTLDGNREIVPLVLSATVMACSYVASTPRQNPSPPLLGVRVGEASHPGPAKPVKRPARCMRCPGCLLHGAMAAFGEGEETTGKLAVRCVAQPKGVVAPGPRASAGMTEEEIGRQKDTYTKAVKALDDGSCPNCQATWRKKQCDWTPCIAHCAKPPWAGKILQVPKRVQGILDEANIPIRVLRDYNADDPPPQLVAHLASIPHSAPAPRDKSSSAAGDLSAAAGDDTDSDASSGDAEDDEPILHRRRRPLPTPGGKRPRSLATDRSLPKASEPATPSGGAGASTAIDLCVPAPAPSPGDTVVAQVVPSPPLTLGGDWPSRRLGQSTHADAVVSQPSATRTPMPPMDFMMSDIGPIALLPPAPPADGARMPPPAPIADRRLAALVLARDHINLAHDLIADGDSDLLARLGRAEAGLERAEAELGRMQRLAERVSARARAAYSGAQRVLADVRADAAAGRQVNGRVVVAELQAVATAAESIALETADRI